MASTSSCPGERALQVGQRLGLVAEGHAQDHDLGVLWTASVFSAPVNEPSGTCSARARRPPRARPRRASRSRPARPASPSRSARPNPSAPVPPTMQTGFSRHGAGVYGVRSGRWGGSSVRIGSEGLVLASLAGDADVGGRGAQRSPPGRPGSPAAIGVASRCSAGAGSVWQVELDARRISPGALEPRDRSLCLLIERSSRDGASRGVSSPRRRQARDTPPALRLLADARGRAAGPRRCDRRDGRRRTS